MLTNIKMRNENKKKMFEERGPKHGNHHQSLSKTERACDWQVF